MFGMSSPSSRTVRAARTLIAALAGTLAAAPAAAAQDLRATLAGVVRDSTGTPVPMVTVTVLIAGVGAYTDRSGHFRIPALPPGPTDLVFRRLGFSPESATVTLRPGRTDSVNVTISAFALELPGVEVKELARRRRLLADFYRRKDAGFGHFITREDIAAREPHVLSDMMRMMPGVEIVHMRDGSLALRMARTASVAGRDCPPEWWVDGIRTPGLNVDDIPPEDIDGVEIYSGPATLPAEFNIRNGTPGCGTILVWTRIPGP
jgi:hypothetical protein